MRIALAILIALTAAANGLGATDGVTFNRDVLPILEKHCQSCHRPGEAAPMSLLDYKSARPWARSIRAAVLQRKMPPWFADSAPGVFANDPRLSDAEIQTLANWADSGAPEGDTSPSPPKKWSEGWNIRPDIVLQMPQPFEIPATGVLQYAYIVIPTGFTKDMWVTAGEIRPEAREAVHHISAIVRPPGAAWLREAKPGVPYIPSESSREGQPGSTDPQAGLIDASDEFLVGYAPGMPAQRFDIDRSAKLVPAGSDIVLQIHYTPNGKTPIRDRTRVGLTLAKTPPARRFFAATASSWRWAIPPGDSNYEGRARLTFGEPVQLVFIQPHMHLRGKDMTVTLLLPDGRSETLLQVSQYDFNWQLIYYFSKPLQLPKGARIDIVAHWDNSAGNPKNPDPSKTVTWGNQSTDEMLSVPMGVIVDREARGGTGRE